jgi:superfamily II DNA or RNA helicase
LKLTIDSVIRLRDVPEETLTTIKSELTLRNPEFDKKRRMGLNRWAWGPEFIKLYSEKRVNNSTEYILPRGYFARLWNIAGLSWDMIDDRRVKLPFIEFPSSPQLRDYQEPVPELAEQWQQGVMIGPCGCGKGHPLDTKIYTPDGVTTIGELHIGDKVIGSDGKACTVTGIFDRGVLPTYKVTFSDDTSILCDGDHIWAVQHYKKRQVDPEYWVNKTTSELLNSRLKKEDGGNMWFIPLVAPVEFEEKSVPVDSYFLGAYLGDGHTSKHTLGFTNCKEDIVEKMNKVKTLKPSCFTNHYFVGAQDIMKSLESLGLRNKRAHEKFVPDIYKYNSVDVRLQILQGLIDTDGEVYKSCVYRFYSTSERMANDVLEIIQSLGGTGKIYSRIGYIGKNGVKKETRLCYTITFKLTNFRPFTSVKHQNNYKERTRFKKLYRAITGIEYVGEMPIRCISVDAKDQLYVAENFTVTHNTAIGMGIIENIAQPTLWVCHTMDLLQQSMDSAVKFLGLTGNQIGIIQGQNMKIGSHITFATVQTLSKRDLTDIKNKFGCIVVDEAHLVFKDAAKARMFESVISQFPAFYRFGLTASEYRSDGLITTMFHVIGPKFYEVAQDDPRLSVMKPRVEFIETDFIYDQGVDENGEKEMLSVQQMYQAMREDGQRNSIVGLVLNRKILSSDYCLVLGDSLEHLGRMFFVMREAGKSAEFISGTTPKKVREQIMADMRAGKYQYLFATYQLAKLGLDIPRLNKLVLATPHRDRTSVQQAVGRIMRPFEGKSKPVVYDIWDSKVPHCRKWGRERVKVYRTLGCEVEGGPRVRE